MSLFAIRQKEKKKTNTITHDFDCVGEGVLLCAAIAEFVAENRFLVNRSIISVLHSATIGNFEKQRPSQSALWYHRNPCIDKNQMKLSNCDLIKTIFCT